MTNPQDFCSVFCNRANAAATLRGSEKYPDIRGRVMFYQLPYAVLVRAEIFGLPKGTAPCENPIFAFHIHSGEECQGDETDAFSKANGHYNPNNCPHPYHAGDLPPLFSVNGRAFSAFLTDRFKVNEILGRTVIIHRNPDDFSSQPSGNAGEKIACGVINRNLPLTF